MKTIFLRSLLIAVVLTALVSVIVWYFLVRRVVPEHASVIPKNAFVVLTLNTRQLAADYSGEEHLFPELKEKAVLEKEILPFTKAITANGSSGISETSDILCFAYRTDESAFMGVAVALKDSTSFGQLMRVHLTREMNFVPWSSAGTPLMRIDTSAAVIGWTRNVALLLYPIGNHGISAVATQCAELLKQQPEQSVLADENFKNHELNSFDAALWVRSDALTAFTGGGDLVLQAVSGVRYFNYYSDFTDGKILVRSEYELENAAAINTMKETALPCEAEDVVGFMRFYLDPSKDSLIAHYVDSPPFTNLPLSDEEATALFPYFDGNCTFLVHDTVSYAVPVVSYDYDADFNPIERTDTVLRVATPTTSTFHITNAGKVRDLLTEWMGRDSIPLTNRGWIYNESGTQSRMILTDELLTVTTFSNADGRSHPIPAQLKNFMFNFDLQRLFQNQDFPLPFIRTKETFSLLEKHLVNLTGTVPVTIGNKSHSEITLTFANTKINGLVQLSDLIARIYSLDHP